MFEYKWKKFELKKKLELSHDGDEFQLLSNESITVSNIVESQCLKNPNTATAAAESTTRYRPGRPASATATSAKATGNSMLFGASFKRYRSPTGFIAERLPQIAESEKKLKIYSLKYGT